MNDAADSIKAVDILLQEKSLVTVPPVPVSASVPSVAGPSASDAPAPHAGARLTPPTPLAGFAPEEFQARRNALRRLCPDGLIVMRGATDDEAVKPAVFQQNSAFFYLTGVETPGAFLVLLPAGLPVSAGLRGVPATVRELLFLPARNPHAELWMGPRLGPGEETEKQTGIQKVADASSFWPVLTAWLRHNPLVYTPAPFGEHAHLSREYAFMQHILHAAPVAQIRDVSLSMGQLRLVKSPAEIARITQAVEITAEGHKAARALIENRIENTGGSSVSADGGAGSALLTETGTGRREYEIEAAIFEAFRSRGARLAFASIVGGGRNATILHYEDNHHVLNAGELAVVDIGAEVDHYCGDLTRTYAVGGAMSIRQREIYDLVRAAFQCAVSEYKPGEDSLQSLDDKCKAFLHESPLRALDADGKEQTMKAFMPHGLSHHLGLDVHDVVQYADREAPLAPGNVITVEPGLYIASESIGVRLEHDFLVTESGLQRLGPDLEM